MKIIVGNHKGGVGKSTMAVHLASGFATLGYRVGLVDIDSQDNTAFLLNMDSDDSLARYLIDDEPVHLVARVVPTGHYATEQRPALGALFLLSSGSRTAEIPVERDDVTLLDRKLDWMAHELELDVIFIDTNPTRTLLDTMYFFAADAFIFVTRASTISIRGMEQIQDAIENFDAIRAEHGRPSSYLLGIIANWVKGNTVLHRENLSALTQREDFGTAGRSTIWIPAISDHITIEESSEAQMPLFVFDPMGSDTMDMWRLVEGAEQAMKEWHAIRVG